MGKRAVAGGVVAAVALLAAGAGLLAASVETDDDLLAFLPDGDAARDLRAMNARFGALDVMILGVAARAGDFADPARLDRLEAATERLQAIPGVAGALSLANLETFAPDPMGGVRVTYLAADRGPGLRERLGGELARPLVSERLDATLLYVFPMAGADTRAIAAAARAAHDELFAGDERVTFGAPFVRAHLAAAAARDAARLTPWAAAAILVAAALALRGLAAALLVVAIPGIAIAVVLGGMGALGARSSLLLSSLPLLVLAVGSALAARAILGRGVVEAGLAATAALAAFLAADVAPLRAFGLAGAVAIAVATALALVLVPAVRTFAPVSARPLDLRAPRAAGWALLAAGAAAVPFALGLRARAAALDGPPGHAARFLAERFGGSTFVQVELAGDLTHPLVLRELAELADRAAALPGVTAVSHIGDALALTHLAMAGERALPDTTEKARLLFGFLQGKPAVRQLVDDERRHAVLQVQVASSPREVVGALRALARERAGDRVVLEGEAARARVREAVTARLQRLGVSVDPARLAAGPGPDAPGTAARVEAALLAFIRSDEFLGELPEEEGAAERLAARAMRGAPGEDLERPLADLWRRERALAWARALAPAAPADRVAEALLDLGRAQALGGPGPGLRLDLRVTGQPVVEEALARGVERDLLRVIGLAIVFLLVILRSPAQVLPPVVALALLGAAARLLGIPLDPVAFVVVALVLALGAAAAPPGGPALAGALLAAAPFLVLVLGEARPTRVLGGLGAAGALAVVLASLVIVPALARRRS